MHGKSWVGRLRKLGGRTLAAVPSRSECRSMLCFQSITVPSDFPMLKVDNFTQAEVQKSKASSRQRPTVCLYMTFAKYSINVKSSWTRPAVEACGTRLSTRWPRLRTNRRHRVCGLYQSLVCLFHVKDAIHRMRILSCLIFGLCLYRCHFLCNPALTSQRRQRKWSKWDI